MKKSPTKENLRKMIERRKAKLIEKAKKDGLYEDFGQKEVRELEDKIESEELYGEKGKIIRSFSDWCMNFDLSDIQAH